MRVLITGGAGFVGRHLVKCLLEHYLDINEIVVVDSLIEGTGAIDPLNWERLPGFNFNPYDYDRFTFVYQDCRDFFKENTDDHCFDIVFHLAAIVGGRKMIDFNPLAVATDLSIDAEYWNWAQRSRPEKSVIFSSSAAYPVALQTYDYHKILTEEDLDVRNFRSKGKDTCISMPDASYGWSKLSMEYLSILAYKRYGLKSVVYRPFSGYGNDQDSAYPFPSIIQRAIDNRNSKEFMVWGTGDQVRDFIHIDDCIRGILTTMDKIEDASPVNLSTGIGASFKGFAGLATQCLGYYPNIHGTSDNPEGVAYRVGDTKFQESLGFKHEITFRNGVENAIECFLNNRVKNDGHLRINHKIRG